MSMISHKIRTAMKTYNCDACRLWLDYGYNDVDISQDDLPTVESCKVDNWKILPGQKYLSIVYGEFGELHHYRARLDMSGLCGRLDLEYTT